MTGYGAGRSDQLQYAVPAPRTHVERFRLTLPFPRFCDLWNDIFAPLQGMEDTVARLAALYPLYLLSNTNPLHFQYIKERYILLRHFRRFILSFEVGSRKPEAQIFQTVIREMGREPGECLYLDDKPDFVEAARSHGLVAWPFTTPEDFHRRLSQHGLW